MKIGIVGENSYIGRMFGSICSTKNYEVEYISSRGSYWQNIEFKKFSVILFAAGIAHVSTNPRMEKTYYEVNYKLTVKIACKAKADGVSQFIFLSSILVYGESNCISNCVSINNSTVPTPDNFYGKSKLLAETELLAMSSEGFIVSILRLPMVYGKGCKGNFPKLVLLAKYLLIFPDIQNKRSILYIDNLCVFLDICISQSLSGILFPQNIEFSSTKDIIDQMAKQMGKKIYFTSLFNPLFIVLSKKIKYLNKIFGSKVYDKSLSKDVEQYNAFSFEESIQRYFEHQ